MLPRVIFTKVTFSTCDVVEAPREFILELLFVSTPPQLGERERREIWTLGGELCPSTCLLHHRAALPANGWAVKTPNILPRGPFPTKLPPAVLFC